MGMFDGGMKPCQRVNLKLWFDWALCRMKRNLSEKHNTHLVLPEILWQFELFDFLDFIQDDLSVWWILNPEWSSRQFFISETSQQTDKHTQINSHKCTLTAVTVCTSSIGLPLALIIASMVVLRVLEIQSFFQENFRFSWYTNFRHPEGKIR